MGPRLRHPPWYRAGEPSAGDCSVHGGDPEQICADVEAELRRVLSADRDDTRPMVVTLIAATEAKDELAPSGRMPHVGELPAMLVGVARAVQNVQDEALLEGRDLPMHGLVITRGALPVPGDREVPDLAASALVGARRVLRNEQTALELAARSMSITPASSARSCWSPWSAGPTRVTTQTRSRCGMTVRMVIVNQSTPVRPTGSSRRSTTAQRPGRELRDRSAPVRTPGRPGPAGDPATCPWARRDRTADGGHRPQLQGPDEGPRRARRGRASRYLLRPEPRNGGHGGRHPDRSRGQRLHRRRVALRRRTGDGPPLRHHPGGRGSRSNPVTA